MISKKHGNPPREPAVRTIPTLYTVKGWNKDYCNQVLGGTNPQPARHYLIRYCDKIAVTTFMSQNCLKF